jgi:hypothetical protein
MKQEKDLSKIELPNNELIQDLISKHGFKLKLKKLVEEELKALEQQSIVIDERLAQMSVLNLDTRLQWALTTVSDYANSLTELIQLTQDLSINIDSDSEIGIKQLIKEIKAITKQSD